MRPLPRPTALSRPFWDGCRDGRLPHVAFGDDQFPFRRSQSLRQLPCPSSEPQLLLPLPRDLLLQADGQRLSVLASGRAGHDLGADLGGQSFAAALLVGGAV